MKSPRSHSGQVPLVGHLTGSGVSGTSRMYGGRCLTSRSGTKRLEKPFAWFGMLSLAMTLVAWNDLQDASSVRHAGYIMSSIVDTDEFNRAGMAIIYGPKVITSLQVRTIISSNVHIMDTEQLNLAGLTSIRRSTIVVHL